MSPRLAAAGLVPLMFVVLMVLYVAGPGSESLRIGEPLPELTIERIEFAGSEIKATVRNTGPVPVTVTVADVNDRIQPAAIEPDSHLERFEAAVVRIPFPWNEAEPYTVGITTHDGTRFERTVDAAAASPQDDLDLAYLFAIIGTYVGVIPVMLGMLWLPFIKRIGNSGYLFFLALTAGLLLFLGLDSIEEAAEIAAESLSASLNTAMLIATSVVLSFLGLYVAGRRFAGIGVAAMIAVGIGLHNFGEGLAIGAAIGAGSLSFGAFLIVGFALHNTTEGVAIATPASRRGTSIPRLAALGLVAGFPAILGAWTGGFAYSPLSAVVFLSVGAGAIAQVLLVLCRIMLDMGGLKSMPVACGIATGMLVMYFTSILV